MSSSTEGEQNLARQTPLPDPHGELKDLRPATDYSFV